MEKFFAPLNETKIVDSSVVNTNGVVNTNDDNIETQFTSLLQDLTQLKSGITDIFTKFRLLEKAVTKELKVARPKKKTANVKTGFDTPVPLSEELCKFIGLPVGSEMSYTDVTQFILNYIQTHKLTQNRTEIVQDEALLQLFGVQTLTHFNLQKHISSHIKLNN
jgi:chromatin remodeling complex protein RSC6